MLRKEAHFPFSRSGGDSGSRRGGAETLVWAVVFAFSAAASNG